MEYHRTSKKILSDRVRMSERASKDIGLKVSMATSKGVCWEYPVRYSEYTKKERSERYGL